MIRQWAVLAVAMLTMGAVQPPEPSDYRMDEYRAPTPVTLRGATVVDTDQAHALWVDHQAAFVDVLTRPPRPPNLPVDTIWRPRPRADIPGSIWLPDTGYGALAPVMQSYLRQGLERASAGDHNRTLVFYCLKDCWMSWNAAKRAMALGYVHVDWYPEGTDGWTEHGFPTEAREPEPRPNTTE